MDKTENSEITTMSHDVPTVSIRLYYDSYWCYYGATMESPRNDESAVNCGVS